MLTLADRDEAEAVCKLLVSCVIRPDIMEFVAISYIKEGEEITINYNGDPTDKTPVRFPLAE